MTATLHRVMCVEDEPDIRTIVKLALETLGGYTVKVCPSGQEALDEVLAFEPDLILLDVMMPVMDGPTTLKKLRELNGASTIPIVFMTAKIQPADIAYYKSLGALNVIPKPFDPMKLAGQVQVLWENERGK